MKRLHLCGDSDKTSDGPCVALPCERKGAVLYQARGNVEFAQRQSFLSLGCALRSDVRVPKGRTSGRLCIVV